MRDMVDRVEPYPMRDWHPAFDRLRRDLDEAIRLERAVAPGGAHRGTTGPAGAGRQQLLGLRRRGVRAGAGQTTRTPRRSSSVDRSPSSTGNWSAWCRGPSSSTTRSRKRPRTPTSPSSTAWSATSCCSSIVLLVSICAAGWWIIAANRRAFDEVAQLTAQLRALSWRTLRVQEDLQRSISRDLHDDFGQIVTAIGTRLGRAQPQGRTGQPDPRGPRRRAANRAGGPRPDPVTVAVAASRRARRLRPGQGARTVRRTVPASDRHRDAIRCDRANRRPSGTTTPSTSIESSRRRSATSAATPGRRTRGCDCAAASTRSKWRSRTVAWGWRIVRPHAGRMRGMGLVNMRERAELMGGQLALRQPPQGGLLVQRPRSRVERALRARGGGDLVSARRIRVLLADDHALVRQGFRRILEDEADIEVVGEAGGGAEAIELDRELDPDVVVLDMAMPEINGMHATIEILRQEARAPHPDPEHVRGRSVRGERARRRARAGTSSRTRSRTTSSGRCACSRRGTLPQPGAVRRRHPPPHERGCRRRATTRSRS